MRQFDKIYEGELTSRTDDVLPLTKPGYSIVTLRPDIKFERVVSSEVRSETTGGSRTVPSCRTKGRHSGDSRVGLSRVLNSDLKTT